MPHGEADILNVCFTKACRPSKVVGMCGLVNTAKVLDDLLSGAVDEIVQQT